MYALDEGARGAKSTCKAFNRRWSGFELITNQGLRFPSGRDLCLSNETCTLAEVLAIDRATRVDDEDDDGDAIDIDNDSELPDYE
jgi:hypothetical protein